MAPTLRNLGFRPKIIFLNIHNPLKYLNSYFRTTLFTIHNLENQKYESTTTFAKLYTIILGLAKPFTLVCGADGFNLRNSPFCWLAFSTIR
ncbi:hypothetical protein BGP_4251 [Beggiatoa sp. PS]|nr:hypothetical protein BGP_4251 [Beggiatoa sp. PS]